MTPAYLVIHTAAFTGRNCDKDVIDQWHRARGWSGIGYHYVILNDRHDTKPDGLIEKGREESRAGAHALGINGRSLGICCIGHGDIDPFTDKQMESLKSLVIQLMTKYAIPISKVIGHREINKLVEADIIADQYRTSKSCPGNKIDMDAIRQFIGQPAQQDAEQVPVDDIRKAIETLQNNVDLYPNAKDELRAFVHHPEVITINN